MASLHLNNFFRVVCFVRCSLSQFKDNKAASKRQALALALKWHSFIHMKQHAIRSLLKLRKGSKTTYYSANLFPKDHHKILGAHPSGQSKYSN
uniref:Uncharacterized protein n=1 Tax=Arundo donax TaxID=35708 RepID=A0A0A9BST0_ARUDO